MAGHSFLPPLGHLEVDVAGLYLSVPIGATGAVGTIDGKGVTSVTRNSAGNYTILLAGSYQEVLNVSLNHRGAADAIDPATEGYCWVVVSDTVATSTPTIVVQFVDAAGGEAADPAASTTLQFRFDLRHSTVS